MTLAVCATPIGNLEDVTLRVLATLREADVVLCEDTRRTRILLERHGISSQLLSYHRHNEAKRTSEILPRLERGELVALASDAGLPAISDPGARLIAAALEAGVHVTVLPGPSAVETALVASGLGAGAGYRFMGYLPRGAGPLAEALEALAGAETTVAFESPQRLPATLAALAKRWPDRPAAVCRELTKRFEEVVRGPAHDLAARFLEPPKGEITLVIGGVEGGEHRDEKEAAAENALAAVAELVAAGLPRRRAAEVVGRLTGQPRNLLYRGSL